MGLTATVMKMKTRVGLQLIISGYIDIEHDDTTFEQNIFYDEHWIPAEKRIEAGNLDEFVMGSVHDIQVFDFEDMKE